MKGKIILVGEANPYGDDPKYSLYPRPVQTAGGRLCKILGLRPHQYLRRFERVNLCVGRWRLRDARRAAECMTREAFFEGDDPTFVLLGAKVCQAFGIKFIPFTTYTHWATETRPDGLESSRIRVASAVILPHPSGRCRLWNELGAVEKARKLLAVFPNERGQNERG